jgi:hypothetical protein
MTNRKLTALSNLAYTLNASLVRDQAALACALSCALSVEAYLKAGDLELAMAAIRNAADFERSARTTKEVA